MADRPRSRFASANGIEINRDIGSANDMSFLEDANTAACEKVEAFLLSWEKKYHMLWDQDIEIYMRYPSTHL